MSKSGGGMHYTISIDAETSTAKQSIDELVSYFNTKSKKFNLTGTPAAGMSAKLDKAQGHINKVANTAYGGEVTSKEMGQLRNQITSVAGLMGQISSLADSIALSPEQFLPKEVLKRYEQLGELVNQYEQAMNGSKGQSKNKEKVTELQKQLAEQQKLLDAANTKKNNAGAHTRTSKQQYDQAQADIAAYEAEIKSLQKQINQRKQRAGSFQTQKEKAESDIRIKKATSSGGTKDSKYINDRQKQITALEAEIKAQNDEIARLESEIAVWKESKSKSEAAAGHARANLNAGTLENKEADAAIKAAEKEKARLESEINSLSGAAPDMSKLTQGLQQAFKDAGVDIDLTKVKVEDLREVITKLKGDKAKELADDMKNIGDQAKVAEKNVKDLNDKAGKSQGHILEDEGRRNTSGKVEKTLSRGLRFGAMTGMARQAASAIYSTISDLDKAMEQTAVVSTETLSSMWDQLPDYTAKAKQLGTSIKSVIEAQTLYVQQGLDMNSSMELGVESMKMARVAGLDSSAATEAMTSALRGFNMELNKASAVRINDVYSELAKGSAADTGDISTAMSKVASIANSAGMEFETTAAFLTQIKETTQESAGTSGTALKTVIARFSEVKDLYTKGDLEGTDDEGQTIDVNKISKALKTAGIDLNKYFLGEVGLDDIFLELSQKWDSLTTVQQRYIATQAAGSRQQSRFIAMMQDYDRTVELTNMAYNSAGSSEEQFAKTEDSLESKTARLKDSWTELLTTIANDDGVKGIVDMLNNLVTGVTNLVNKLSGATGDLKTWSSLMMVGGATVLGFKAKNAAGAYKNDKSLGVGSIGEAILGKVYNQGESGGLNAWLENPLGKLKGTKLGQRVLGGSFGQKLGSKLGLTDEDAAELGLGASMDVHNANYNRAKQKRESVEKDQQYYEEMQQIANNFAEQLAEAAEKKNKNITEKTEASNKSITATQEAITEAAQEGKNTRIMENTLKTQQQMKKNITKDEEQAYKEEKNRLERERKQQEEQAYKDLLERSGLQEEYEDLPDEPTRSNNPTPSEEPEEGGEEGEEPEGQSMSEYLTKWITGGQGWSGFGQWAASIFSGGTTGNFISNLGEALTNGELLSNLGTGVKAGVAAGTMVGNLIGKARDKNIQTAEDEMAITGQTLSVLNDQLADTESNLKQFDTLKQKNKEYSQQLTYLTRGSKEYNEALRNNNQQVREILSENSELSDYVDYKNGVLVTQDEFWTKYEEKLQKQQAQQQIGVWSAEIDEKREETKASMANSDIKNTLISQDEKDAILNRTTLAGGIAGGVGGALGTIAAAGLTGVSVGGLPGLIIGLLGGAIMGAAGAGIIGSTWGADDGLDADVFEKSLNAMYRDGLTLDQDSIDTLKSGEYTNSATDQQLKSFADYMGDDLSSFVEAVDGNDEELQSVLSDFSSNQEQEISLISDILATISDQQADGSEFTEDEQLLGTAYIQDQGGKIREYSDELFDQAKKSGDSEIIFQMISSDGIKLYDDDNNELTYNGLKEEFYDSLIDEGELLKDNDKYVSKATGKEIKDKDYEERLKDYFYNKYGYKAANNEVVNMISNSDPLTRAVAIANAQELGMMSSAAWQYLTAGEEGQVGSTAFEGLTIKEKEQKTYNSLADFSADGLEAYRQLATYGEDIFADGVTNDEIASAWSSVLYPDGTQVKIGGKSYTTNSTGEIISADDEAANGLQVSEYFQDKGYIDTSSLYAIQVQDELLNDVNRAFGLTGDDAYTSVEEIAKILGTTNIGDTIDELNQLTKLYAGEGELSASQQTALQYAKIGSKENRLSIGTTIESLLDNSYDTDNLFEKFFGDSFYEQLEGLSAYNRDKAYNLISSTNWSDADAVEETINQLEKFGITFEYLSSDIEEGVNTWDALADAAGAIDKYLVPAGEKMQVVGKLLSELNTQADETRATITKEQYNALRASGMGKYVNNADAIGADEYLLQYTVEELREGIIAGIDTFFTDWDKAYTSYQNVEQYVGENYTRGDTTSALAYVIGTGEYNSAKIKKEIENSEYSNGYEFFYNLLKDAGVNEELVSELKNATKADGTEDTEAIAKQAQEIMSSVYQGLDIEEAQQYMNTLLSGLDRETLLALANGDNETSATAAQSYLYNQAIASPETRDMIAAQTTEAATSEIDALTVAYIENEEALAILNSVAAENYDILKDGTYETDAQRKAYNKLFRAAKQLFKNMTQEQFEEALPNLLEWANGNEEALNLVRKQMADKAIAPSVEGTDAEGKLTDYSEKITEVQAQMQSIDGSTVIADFQANTNNLLQGITGTKEELAAFSAYLEGLGWEVTFIPGEEVDLGDGQTLTTGYLQITGADGSTTSSSSGGGGGGGGEDYETSLEKYYNKYARINELQKQRNLLEQEYDNLLNSHTATYDKLADNLQKQLDMLQEEKSIQEFLAQAKRDDLKDAVKTSKYSEYITWDEDLEQPVIDWNAINAIKDSEKGKEVEEELKKIEDLEKQVDEADETLEEINGNISDIYEKNRETYLEFEGQIRDALKQQLQDEIDNATAINEAINEANTKLIDSINSSLEKQRQERENQETEEELSDKERRLAYLRQDSSNANALEIAQLEKELEEAQEDYTDTLIDQKISDLQEQNDEAAEQRQEQIDLMTASLDWQEKNGKFNDEIYRLVAVAMSEDDEEVKTLLAKYGNTMGMTAEEAEQWANEYVDNVAQAGAHLKLNNSTANLGLEEGTSITFTDGGGNTVQGKINANGYVETSTGLYKSVWRDNNGVYQTSETDKDAATALAEQKKKEQEEAEKNKTTTEKTSEGSVKVQDPPVSSGGDGDGSNGVVIVEGELLTQAGAAVANLKNMHTESNTTAGDTATTNSSDTWVVKTGDGKIFTGSYAYVNGKAAELKNRAAAGTITGADRTGKITGSYTVDGKTYFMTANALLNSESIAQATKKLKDDIDSKVANINKVTISKALNGGLFNTTGLMQIDGTASAPELVLNARDTENFLQLREVLSSLMTSGNSFSESNGDNYYEINLNVDQIASDYDVDQLATRIKKIIYDDSMYRNVNTINRLR